MISNSSLKLAIEAAYNNNEKLNVYEKMATKIILYKYLLSIQNTDSNKLNNITDLVSAYITQFESKFLELKNKYLSYSKIIFFLKKNSYNNLLVIDENDINKVYDLYLDKSEIPDYNINSYDPKVYNVDSLTNNDDKYLSYIHFNIMNPIIKYYRELYKINMNDMKIISSNEIVNNIGKKIVFYINGIDSIKVYFDIKNKNIVIPYYSININYPYIELINK